MNGGPKLVLVLEKPKNLQNFPFRPDEIILLSPPRSWDFLSSWPRETIWHIPYCAGSEPSNLPPSCRIWFRLTAGQKEELARLSSQGKTVEIQELSEASSELLCELSHFFFHEKQAKAPIEPLATLFRLVFHRLELSLWEIFGPQTEAVLFVNEEGRKAATEKDLKVGRFLGAAGGEPGQIENPKQSFLFRLPKEYPQCLSCPYFFMCQGWAEWVGNCRAWRPFLADFLKEIGALKKDLAQARRLNAYLSSPLPVNGPRRLSPQVFSTEERVFSPPTLRTTGKGFGPGHS